MRIGERPGEPVGDSEQVAACCWTTSASACTRLTLDSLTVAGRIRDADIAEVRERNRIDEVVG
ncbi:MAG: hypothetical protein M3257_03160, partial [Actinomycetota bacterium]|nr:hypothetical protein [Actinomycetota bacterium]